MSPVSITQQTLKKLFALSGNKCAFSNCNNPIYDTENDSLIGEMCHIKAKRANGPRFDENQTDEERNSFENLILMCSNHHIVIDDDPASYIVERLQKIKADHESQNIREEPSESTINNIMVNLLGNVTLTRNNQDLSQSEVQNSKLLQSGLVNSFRGYNPSKKDLLDLDDIKYNISKLKRKNVTPKDEERILKDISLSLSDITYIETLKEESKITLNNLLEFLYDFLLCKEDPTLNGVLKVLTWICRSEMLNTAKSIYYEYLVSLLDKKKRSYDLLEILFSFRHFEDRVLWLSTAIDEKNIDFINILSGDLGTPKLYEQKFEIRDMLYEKLDLYEQDDKSQEIVQKINFLLQKLRNIKKSN